MRAQSGRLLCSETLDPESTVRRARCLSVASPLAEVARYGSLGAYLRKAPPAEDEYEYVYARQYTTYYGAESLMNRWNPTISTSGDHTLTQIWVARGSGLNTETVEAGIIRRSGSDAKLFIFTTNSNYQPPEAPGCWNGNCAFVQTDFSVVLDGGWGSYSSSGGDQWENWFLLLKDDDAGHWWFRLEGTWVGYWPRTYFDSNGLINKASRYTFGGEVFR